MTRRAPRGGGAILFRNGAWWVQRSKTVDGQRRQWRDGPFETEQLAKLSTKTTWEQTVDAGLWLTAWAQRTERAARQSGRYAAAKIVESHVRLHLASALEGRRIDSIKPSDCVSLWRDLLEAGKSPKTVRNIRSTLSAAMQEATLDELIARNPVRDAPVPRQHRAAHRDEIEVLGPSVANEFARWGLEHLDDEVWALPSLIALETGLRRGEVLAVTRDCIDWSAQRVRITEQLIEIDGQWRRGPLKTARARRTVVITPRLHQALQQVLARKVRPITRNVCVNPKGWALNPDSWGQWLKKSAPDMIRGKVTPHGLRHTFASRLLAAGVPEQTVSALLGHASTDITRRVYSHHVEDRPEDTTAAVVAALGE